MEKQHQGSEISSAPSYFVILVMKFEGYKTAVTKGVVQRRSVVARCCQGTTQEVHLLPGPLHHHSADQVQHGKPAPTSSLKVT